MFYHSLYSAGLRTRQDGRHEYVRKTVLYHYAVRDHKALFRLLYNLPAFAESTGKENRIVTAEACRCLANVTIHAEFYGILESVAEGVADALVALPEVWEDVAGSPEFYLGLAIKLRAGALFAEALRHIIGEEQGSVRRDLSLYDAIEDDLKLLVYKKRAELAEITWELSSGLQRFALSTKRHYNSWGRVTSHSPDMFLNNNRYKSTEDGHQYLARSIYGEWLHANLNRGYYRDSNR